MQGVATSLVRDVVFDLPFSNFDGDVYFGLALVFYCFLGFAPLFFPILFESFLFFSKLREAARWIGWRAGLSFVRGSLG